MTRYFLFACLSLLLMGCEPEATPFPVDIPTLAPPTATAAPIRYALAANTASTVFDMELLGRNAQITTLTKPIDPADLGERFDIIAAYGLYPDATPSPTSISYTLLINSDLSPLDKIADFLSNSVVPVTIAELLDIPGTQPFSTNGTLSQTALRTELANAGWPDGIDLLFAHSQAVGVDALLEYFARSGIRLNAAPHPASIDHVHLVLVTWVTPDERQEWIEWAGAGSQAIDLFTLPISYWATPDLMITYSPLGWPIATRP